MDDAPQTGQPAVRDHAAIAAPTLVIPVGDDRCGTAANARHIAGEIPGAELGLCPRGGHVRIGHDAAPFGAVDGLLRRTLTAG